MIRRAVVHIGIEKTGTKTIQRALFSARSELLSQAQILYPSATIISGATNTVWAAEWAGWV